MSVHLRSGTLRHHFEQSALNLMLYTNGCDEDDNTVGKAGSVATE